MPQHTNSGTALQPIEIGHYRTGILGIGQGEYSASVVERAGIPVEVTAHPTNYGVEIHPNSREVHSGELGRRMRARNATLNMFEWQAGAFYPKQGYDEFGRIDDYIQGFYAAYMKKALEP